MNRIENPSRSIAKYFACTAPGPLIKGVSDAVKGVSKGIQSVSRAADALDAAGDVGRILSNAPKGAGWLADAMKGWKNGEVIPGAVLNRLRSRLQRNDVTIMQSRWAQETLGKAGAGGQFVRFKDGTAALLLRPNATRYQIAHELRHYEHWLADPAAYAKLSKLAREEYVFDALKKGNHWRLFNNAERQHALDYIEYVRKLYGN